MSEVCNKNDGAEQMLLQTVQNLSTLFINKCFELNLHRATCKDEDAWKANVIDEIINLRREKQEVEKQLELV